MVINSIMDQNQNQFYIFFSYYYLNLNFIINFINFYFFIIISHFYFHCHFHLNQSQIYHHFLHFLQHFFVIKLIYSNELKLIYQVIINLHLITISYSEVLPNLFFFQNLLLTFFIIIIQFISKYYFYVLEYIMAQYLFIILGELWFYLHMGNNQKSFQISIHPYSRYLLLYCINSLSEFPICIIMNIKVFDILNDKDFKEYYKRNYKQLICSRVEQ